MTLVHHIILTLQTLQLYAWMVAFILVAWNTGRWIGEQLWGDALPD